jgi:hypothetical protein
MNEGGTITMSLQNGGKSGHLYSWHLARNSHPVMIRIKRSEQPAIAEDENGCAT